MSDDDVIGYYVEGEEMICPKCSDNPMYNYLLTNVERVAFPDGFTCSDCGDEVAVPDDWQGE